VQQLNTPYNEIVRRNSRVLLYLLITLLLMTAMVWRDVSAQQASSRHFPTGHWVRGNFLVYYDRNPNPELHYGYPISEEITDKITGLRVQYFQKARFEYHPENPPGERVILTRIGELTYEPGGVVDISPNNPACRIFGTAAFPVCYSFLDFFLNHGGQAELGQPISSLEFHGDRIMQYFEFGRIEWHPENSPGERITLGIVGSVYFDIRYPGGLDDPGPAGPLGPQDVSALRPNVFMTAAVVSARDTQTIYVTVRDQNLNPVEGAIVSFIVKQPSGDTIPLAAPVTDEDGLSQQSFAVFSDQLGLAEVIVTVTFDRIIEEIRTSFRFWW
jgi:hypothetical protein